MGVVAQLAQRTEVAESRLASAEFVKFARVLMACGGNRHEALEKAAEHRARPRVVDIFKSAVTGGTLSDWSAIADYKVISQAFSESLRTVGCYDAMLPDFTPAPLRSRGITITTGITGSVVGERAVKPISTIALGNALVEPKKAAAIIVMTDEVVRSADATVNSLFANELKKGVVAAVDATFLSALVASTVPVASAGATFNNILTDLGVLVDGVVTGPNSKLFYVTSPANMKKLLLKSTGQGGIAFPALGDGSLIPGITAIASDQLAAGVAIMVDATAIAGSADALMLDASNTTNLEMQTTPDSPPTGSTVVTSLYQSNLTALRCERFFGFTLLRSNAVASLSGVSY